MQWHLILAARTRARGAPHCRHKTVLCSVRGGRWVQALGYTDFPEHDAARPADFFDTPPDRDLTLCCVVGIKDPVRKEVPGAVRTCVRAGIRVRMVTGDNIHTAKHIARECGILDDTGYAIEGPEFRATPRDEMMRKLPNLQVRAAPGTPACARSCTGPTCAAAFGGGAM